MILRRRTIVLWQLGIAISLILSILALNLYFHSTPLQTNAALRNLAPSLNHLFGTDGLGRDMFVRTIKGLYFSLQVGLLGALMGVILATVFGVLAGLGNSIIDKIIAWLVDLFIGMPHLIFYDSHFFCCWERCSRGHHCNGCYTLAFFSKAYPQ